MMTEAKFAIAAVSLSLLFASACGDDSNSGTGGKGDAGSDASDLCPDPKDPRVHYQSADPNECIGVVLQCTRDQNGCQNSCGCGCIDKGDPMCPDPTDPAIHWISHDPSGCVEAGTPKCESGDIPFNNTCGCGCTTPGS